MSRADLSNPLPATWLPETIRADLLQALGSAALAVSVAIVVLMLLPRLLRGRFGAGVAYAAWWLVPFALIATFVPTRTIEVEEPVAAVAPMTETISLGDMPTTAIFDGSAEATTADLLVEALSSRSSMTILIALWLIGALAMALHLWRQQRSFERGLGRLRPLHDDLWEAQASLGLPALLGVMRARIVLPDDFERRYDPRERHLMLAHERVHRRRGDHLANFAMAALRCAFWFNPLVHLAARSFRHDQELACDQAVIAAHPDSRRTYGEAMLKTLMADRQAPLGCHWGFSHPLKERVMQLKSPTPRPWARRLGAATVAVLALGTGFAVWSAQPARRVPLGQGAAPLAIAPLVASPVASPLPSANDGVYVYVELVDPLQADDGSLSRVASWLKPGSLMPVGMEVAGGGASTAVKVEYKVERSAGDVMTVVARAAAVKMDQTVQSLPKNAPELRVVARKDGYSRIEHVIGTQGARLVLQVIRAAGPCNGRAAYRVEVPEPEETQPYHCFPDAKQADASKSQAYGTASRGPGTRIARNDTPPPAPPAPPAPAAPRARPALAAPPAPATPMTPPAPRAAPAPRSTPTPMALPAPVAAPAPVAPAAPAAAPEPPAPPAPLAPEDAALVREMRTQVARADAARKAEASVQASAARSAASARDVEAARAATVEATHAANAAAARVDDRIAERALARSRSMTNDERDAELARIRGNIESRRGALRAKAAESAAAEHAAAERAAAKDAPTQH